MKNGIDRKYYKSGKLRSETLYQNGKIYGAIKEYYENGRLKATVPYQDGKQHGIENKFYESGKLKEEKQYHSGRVIGDIKEYDKDGNLLETIDLPEEEYKRESELAIMGISCSALSLYGIFVFLMPNIQNYAGKSEFSTTVSVIVAYISIGLILGGISFKRDKNNLALWAIRTSIFSLAILIIIVLVTAIIY